jgi:hypothetical protein
MYSLFHLSFELNGHGLTTIGKHKCLQGPVYKIAVFKRPVEAKHFASIPPKNTGSSCGCFRIAPLDDMQALARILQNY